jgi:hypothetical protein
MGAPEKPNGSINAKVGARRFFCSSMMAVSSVAFSTKVASST